MIASAYIEAPGQRAPGIDAGSYQRWTHVFPVEVECARCLAVSRVPAPVIAPAAIHETSWG